MTESEQLTEGSYVYTDLGIEQVHWCEVNGEKELVTPKGYIHGEVPSVNRHFQLVGENAILIAENAQLKSKLQLKETAYDFDTARLEEENTKLKEILMSARNYLKSYRDLYSKDDEDIVDFIKEIDQVLKKNE